jgi:hypothetical protein
MNPQKLNLAKRCLGLPINPRPPTTFALCNAILSQISRTFLLKHPWLSLPIVGAFYPNITLNGHPIEGELAKALDLRVFRYRHRLVEPGHH